MNDAAHLLRHANRLLLLLLVGLKLTGSLTWSWWAILAPAGATLVAFFLGALAFGPDDRHAMTVRQSFAARR